MNTGHTTNLTRPIRSETDLQENPTESEAIGRRISEVIGDEARRAFARRSGVSDSALRDYISGKKTPGLDAAIAIASSGGVTVDWLATGRPPKTRAELRAMQEAASAPSVPLDMNTLTSVVEGVEEYLHKRKLQLRPDKKAALVALLYDQVAPGATMEPGTLERFMKLAS